MFRKEIQIRICVRFMEGDYGSNVHAGLEKVSALERFCYSDSLGIRPGQNSLSVLERCLL